MESHRASRKPVTTLKRYYEDGGSDEGKTSEPCARRAN